MMKIKKFFKKIIGWNSFLILIIIATIVIGLILIMKSNETFSSTLLGFGTGLISSGIVSFIIEFYHIIMNSSKIKKLKSLFYSDVKKFINEFLYYSSFFLPKNNLNTIDMLYYQSNTYNRVAKKFEKSSIKYKDRVLDDINFLVKQRRNFKLILKKIENEKFDCVIHGIIDIKIEQLLSGIIFDYSWIIDCFDENNSLAVIPEAYSNILSSVATLIKMDDNLKTFRQIYFYSSRHKSPGYIKYNDYKKLSKQDKTLLSEYEIVK